MGGSHRRDLVDEKMHTLFGLAAGTFTGHREDFFGLFHEEDRERARGEIARTIEDCAEFDGEFRTVWPSDGSVRFLRMRWKVHFDEDAKVLTDHRCRLGHHRATHHRVGFGERAQAARNVDGTSA